MRFAQKLTLTIVLLLCVTLSVGGAWNIQQNLNHALDTALQQDTALHQRECYMLEAWIIRETGVGAAHQKIAESVKQYAEEIHAPSGRESSAFAVFTRKHGLSLYSGMPSDIPYMDQYKVVQNGAGSAQYIRTPQKEYLLMASPLHGTDYIYHESARLEALSGALLQLLGLEHEQLKLVPTPMTQVLAEMQRSLPQLEVQLQVDCPQNAVVLAERTLLADLLRNLVLNAAAASPAGGRVAVRCCPQGEKWAICVEDWGQGIPEEELDKILEPFYRVDKSRARKNGGNGLGLNLCAQIAQLHGSSLQIKSRLGQGTTVTLLLKKGEKL